MHADEVREIREAYGWTQDAMAEKVGVSKRTIGNWENGRPIPPAGVGKIRDAVERAKHEAAQASLRSHAEDFGTEPPEPQPFTHKKYSATPEGYLEVLADRLQRAEDRLDHLEDILFGTKGIWSAGVTGYGRRALYAGLDSPRRADDDPKPPTEEDFRNSGGYGLAANRATRERAFDDQSDPRGEE